MPPSENCIDAHLRAHNQNIILDTRYDMTNARPRFSETILPTKTYELHNCLVPLENILKRPLYNWVVYIIIAVMMGRVLCK
jgi:hypothetical protein